MLDGTFAPPAFAAVERRLGRSSHDAPNVAPPGQARRRPGEVAYPLPKQSHRMSLGPRWKGIA